MDLTSLRPTRRTLLAALGATAFASATSIARATPSATLLTVRGRTRTGAELLLDRAAIWSVGPSAIDTTTPWYEGRHRFEGVRLGALLRQVFDGAPATPASVHFHALNDYEVDIPAEDVRRYDPILAMRRDGEDLTVRDKGPIFLVYPFDDHDELRTSRFYSRAIWQVDAMEIP